MASEEAIYWDEIAKAWKQRQPNRLWRVHSDSVYTALLTRWLPAEKARLILKTDLFDEATGDGLYPALADRAQRVIGIDLSIETLRAAQSRQTALCGIGADVCCLPFTNNQFDVILSNSTLDHFKILEELLTGLRELYRVLRPGGQMILTLDNLVNPIIFLRNKLPFHLLYRLGIVPYYVGATCGPNGLRIILEKVGFKLLEVDTMMHCPRVLAVAVARWMQEHTGPKSQGNFLRFLQAFERLSRLPTRSFTGHFIAVRAKKSMN